MASSSSSSSSSSSNHEIKFKGLKFTTSVADSSALVNTFLNELRSSLSVDNTNIMKPVVGIAVKLINPDSADDDKVATLQLCHGTRCVIIQLLHLESIPQSLKTFLADPDICFVSVGVTDVVSKLRRDFAVECVCWRNLRPLDDMVYTRELFARCPDQELVKKLINEVVVLCVLLPKNESCSDWTVRSLSMEQIKYASMLPYLYFLVGSKLLL